MRFSGGKTGLMNREYPAYRRLYNFLKIFVFLFFRIRCIGKEHLAPGPAVICANHSSNLDPIFLAFSAGLSHHFHFMAKAELFKIPILSHVLKAIGCFPVKRGQSDVGSIKIALKYLKAEEKVVIFPEGTRVKIDEAGEAKNGAVRIADQLSVPIVPVYIPRNKKLFHKYTIVFGTPYLVNPEKKKLIQSDYNLIADELMTRIIALKVEDNKYSRRSS